MTDSFALAPVEGLRPVFDLLARSCAQAVPGWTAGSQVQQGWFLRVGWLTMVLLHGHGGG